MFFAIILLLAVSACKKTKFAPEGPTDESQKYAGNRNFHRYSINTAGVRHSHSKHLGTVAPVKYRFITKIASQKLRLLLKINGETFPSPVNSTYMDYKGQMKIIRSLYFHDKYVLATVM